MKDEILGILVAETLQAMYETRKLLRKSLGKRVGNMIYEDVLKQAAMEEDEAVAYMTEFFEENGLCVEDEIDDALEGLKKINQKLN